MRTVYKYPGFQLQDHEVMLPVGAKFLHWQASPDGQFFGPLSAWFEVDTDAPLEPRVFTVFGTGHPIPADADELKFVHLATRIDDPFVWHLYEKVIERTAPVAP